MSRDQKSYESDEENSEKSKRNITSAFSKVFYKYLDNQYLGVRSMCELMRHGEEWWNKLPKQKKEKYLHVLRKEEIKQSKNKIQDKHVDKLPPSDPKSNGDLFLLNNSKETCPKPACPRKRQKRMCCPRKRKRRTCRRRPRCPRKRRKRKC